MTNATLKSMLAIVGIMIVLTAHNAVASMPGNPISGTWTVNGMPEPTCGVPPFTNIVTITRDGKMINIDPDVGTAVGESLRTGANTFTQTFFGYIDANTLYEVHGLITLVNANEFTGTFDASITDAAGNVLCAYAGTVTANRMILP